MIIPNLETTAKVPVTGGGCGANRAARVSVYYFDILLAFFHWLDRYRVYRISLFRWFYIVAATTKTEPPSKVKMSTTDKHNLIISLVTGDPVVSLSIGCFVATLCTDINVFIRLNHHLIMFCFTHTYRFPQSHSLLQHVRKICSVVSGVCHCRELAQRVIDL